MSLARMRHRLPPTWMPLIASCSPRIKETLVEASDCILQIRPTLSSVSLSASALSSLSRLLSSRFSRSST